MDLAVLLSRENPTLPVAELEALLAVHGGSAEPVQPGVMRVTGGPEPLQRMALAHAWGRFVAAGSLGACVAAASASDGVGSIAVRATRIGTGRSISRAQTERRIGAALAAAGHAVDLSAPERIFDAWISGDMVTLVERRGLIDRGRFERRHATDRDHFSPVTLHPRRAASLVHLARVAPGGRVYDPFCGTGGILLEAALDGYDAWGSDLDAWMVQGTLQALADDGPEPLHGTAFVADIGEAGAYMDGVEGIVTDLPYGRASTTNHEALEALYDRAFDTFADLLQPGARAVIGCPDAHRINPIEAHGFAIVERHAEFVHKSLTRHYIVAERLA